MSYDLDTIEWREWEHCAIFVYKTKSGIGELSLTMLRVALVPLNGQLEPSPMEHVPCFLLRLSPQGWGID